MTDHLSLSAGAPTLVEGDGRLVRAVKVIEDLFPGERLIFETRKRGRWIGPVKVLNRAGRLRGRGNEHEKMRDDFPELFNGLYDEDRKVSFGARAWPAFMRSHRQPELAVWSHIPGQPPFVARAFELARRVCECIGAWCGEMSWSETAVTTGMQYIHHPPPGAPVPRDLRTEPPLGLPELFLPTPEEGPARPDHLGWINYWSAETCAMVGFPDPARDADLLRRAEKLDNGAWIFRLTEEPLDLDRPEHLQALKDAYERFPIVGGRHRARQAQ